MISPDFLNGQLWIFMALGINRYIVREWAVGVSFITFKTHRSFRFHAPLHSQFRFSRIPRGFLSRVRSIKAVFFFTLWLNSATVMPSKAHPIGSLKGGPPTSYTWSEIRPLWLAGGYNPTLRVVSLQFSTGWSPPFVGCWTQARWSECHCYQRWSLISTRAPTIVVNGVEL